MNMRLQPTPPEVVYPDSDGKPMADNMTQFRWITTFQGNLDALFRDAPNVLVAGDNLIYPKEGDVGTCQAPDVYVAFGPSKGDRGSYKVWDEGGVFPQVVIEIHSPSNTSGEMKRKRHFYRKYGAEEYYHYDPYDNTLEAWTRRTGRWEEEDELNGFVSPRLGVRFDTSGPELTVYKPNGERFLTFVELDHLARAEKARAEKLAAKLRELGIDPDTL